MSKVVVFGIGRGAEVAYRFLSRDSDHKVCGFAVDRPYIVRETFHDFPSLRSRKSRGVSRLTNIKCLCCSVIRG